MQMKTEMPGKLIEVQVLVIYDHVEAGKKAEEFCSRVQGFLGGGYQLHLHLWNMAALQIAALAQACMETAEWPCILTVAVNGNRPLPEFFKRWLTQYARRSHPAIGIMAVQVYAIFPTKLELNSPHQDLKQIAKDAGMAFLSEAVELPDGALANGIDKIHETALMTTKLIEHH
jgi:hypothetical protein